MEEAKGSTYKSTTTSTRGLLDGLSLNGKRKNADKLSDKSIQAKKLRYRCEHGSGKRRDGGCGPSGGGSGLSA